MFRRCSRISTNFSKLSHSLLRFRTTINAIVSQDSSHSSATFNSFSAVNPYEATKIHYNILYEAKSELMCRVYISSDRNTGILSTVKVYQKNQLSSIGATSLVYTEVYILERLKHRYLQSIQFAHEDENFVYIATPYYPRGSLEDHVMTSTFTSNIAALKITRQLLKVLQYLHKWNVAHLDIQPANIMIDENGDIKLGGFGSAHIWNDGSKAWCKNRRGHHLYVAPAVDSDRTYNPVRADIWSVGAVLYFLISKRQLFSGRCGYAHLTYHCASQEDIGLEMLAMGIVKRPQLVQKLLWSLLQTDPETPISLGKAIDLCEDAISTLQ